MVLAGGGPAASAWEIGLVTGMADTGLYVTGADLFVGTSAGSRVALHLACGESHEQAYERRLQPMPASARRSGAGPVDWVAIREGVARAKEMGGSKTDILRRIGALALTLSPGEVVPGRRDILASQLPVTAWPEKRVLVATVNADTGERRAFDREGGMDLVDAVLASTAAFGVPPVLFDGGRYIDGGYYCTDNADLAAGCDRVLVLALKRPPEIPSQSVATLDESVAILRESGSQVRVIQPDEIAAAEMAAAGGFMNPEISPAAAKTGRSQGRRIVNQDFVSFWGSRRSVGPVRVE